MAILTSWGFKSLCYSKSLGLLQPCTRLLNCAIVKRKITCFRLKIVKNKSLSSGVRFSSNFKLLDKKIINRPSAIEFLTSRLALYLLIPRVDRDFNVDDFAMHTEEVLRIVTAKLAAADFNDLIPVFTPDCFSAVTNGVKKMGVRGRESIKMEDPVFKYFLLNARVTDTDTNGKNHYNEGSDQQVRNFIEISLMFICIKGLTSVLTNIENANVLYKLYQITLKRECKDDVLGHWIISDFNIGIGENMRMLLK